jgi:hypothetical protein
MWKTCPGFQKYECNAQADARRKDGEPMQVHLVACNKKPARKYRSLTKSPWGHIYRQVFRAFGPPNPDPKRYTVIDHIDNNPLNDYIKNLRWSCKSLNALNTDDDQSKGWTLSPRPNRYKAHIKWMGKVTSLGRYKTKEEATQVYKEIKAWLQIAYRKHEYQDKCLVWAWRCERYLRMYESGDKSFWTQRNRISSMFNRFLIQTGLMTKKERGISEDLWPAKIREYLQICRV